MSDPMLQPSSNVPQTLETWQPDPEVTSHAGEPLSDQLHFLHPPPDEIGEVITAFSTLKKGKKPMPLATRQLVILAPGALVLLGILQVQKQIFPNETLRDSLWPGMIGGMFVALIMYLVTRFRHTMTYVGRAGVARLQHKGPLSQPGKCDSLVFESAADLRSSQTRQYVNGVYTGTNYRFVWTNEAGKAIFKLVGSYRSSKTKAPKPTSVFHFARSAETAWSLHLIELLDAELAEHGCVQFDLARDKWVRVGPGFLELRLGKEEARLEVADIRDLTIASGSFKVVHKDAKWFGKGKFSFEYGQLANAKVFLLALERLLGFQFD